MSERSAASGVSVSGLSCVGCGHPVPVTTESAIAECPACSTLYHVEGLKGTPWFEVQRRVDGTAAKNALARWTRRFGISGDFKRKVRLGEAGGVLAPLWFAEGQVIGWRFGYVIRRTTDSKGRVTERKVYKELEVNDRFWWGEPACASGGLKLRGRYVKGLALARFDPSDNPDDLVLEMGGDEEEARAQGDRFLFDAARSAHPLHKVTDEVLRIVNREFWLVYYPFFKVNYEYKNLKYAAVVDAALGKLVYARAPRAQLGNVFWKLAGMLIADVVLSVVAVAMLNAASIAAVVALFVLNAYVAKAILRGGEVVADG